MGLCQRRRNWELLTAAAGEARRLLAMGVRRGFWPPPAHCQRRLLLGCCRRVPIAAHRCWTNVPDMVEERERRRGRLGMPPWRVPFECGRFRYYYLAAKVGMHPGRRTGEGRELDVLDRAFEEKVHGHLRAMIEVDDAIEMAEENRYLLPTQQSNKQTRSATGRSPPISTLSMSANGMFRPFESSAKAYTTLEPSGPVTAARFRNSSVSTR